MMLFASKMLRIAKKESQFSNRSRSQERQRRQMYLTIRFKGIVATKVNWTHSMYARRNDNIKRRTRSIQLHRLVSPT